MVGKIKAAGIGDKILELWDMGYSSIKIADMLGVVTDRSMLRYVKKHGRNTSDTRKNVVCEHCGQRFLKVRSVFLRSNKHFCSNKCYWVYLKNPEYIRSVQGSRASRKAIKGTGYKFGEWEVVHHKDGDCNNRELSNLMVFANQSDYIKWHRNGGPDSGVKPLWPDLFFE